MAATTRSLESLSAPLRTLWAGLAVREKRLVTAAAAVLVIFLLWTIALSPALRTLREAPRRIDTYDAQLQAMQRLAAEARELRSAVPLAPGQAGSALKLASERLGDKARLVQQGDRATLTVTGVSGEQISAWVAEARSGARARPVEATLTRGEQGYSGTLVVVTGGNP